MSKTKTAREEMGPELVQRMKDAIEDFLDSDVGFVIINRGKKISDAFHNMCSDCVKHALISTVEHAESVGALPKEHHDPVEEIDKEPTTC
jgi:hypothetical protein